MLTAMAFEHFARTRPDIVVLEVGMGGRLDATNVVEPRLSVITDVALDHQQYLGNTVSEIAREKAGIIRAGGVVVTLPQMPEANDAIGNTILDLGARAVSAVPFVPPISPGSAEFWETAAKGLTTGDTGVTGEGARIPRSRYPLQVMGQQILVESPLIGRHQLRNIALAVASAEELHNQGFRQITARSIEQGIRETYWPGRFQVVPARGDAPEIVLDVAHNPAGAWALRSTLSAAYEDRPVTLVFGVMRDKAVSEVAEILFPVSETVVLTQPNNPRAATPAEIRQAASRVEAAIREVPEVAAALAEARQIAGPAGLVVVTGSIYLVGEMMQVLGLRI
jgi:dihydrofolate synthase/folylpolyglutamate synthase